MTFASGEAFARRPAAADRFAVTETRFRRTVRRTGGVER